MCVRVHSFLSTCHAGARKDSEMEREMLQILLECSKGSSQHQPVSEPPGLSGVSGDVYAIRNYGPALESSSHFFDRVAHFAVAL